MNKQTIRLNESQLHKLIKESVKKVLKENALGGRNINKIISLLRHYELYYDFKDCDCWDCNDDK